MVRSSADEDVPTLKDALFARTVDDLIQLCGLIGSTESSTRKSVLVPLILQHLEGDRLQEVWQTLDETQQLAIAEAAHSEMGQYSDTRFKAKYGRTPDWGARDFYRLTPSKLGLFFSSELRMPQDLRDRLRALVPAPVPDSVRAVPVLPDRIEREYTHWSGGAGRYDRTKVSLPLTVRASERQATLELLAVLRLMDGSRVAASETTGCPTAAALRAISAVLEGGDYYAAVEGEDVPGPIRSLAWPLLLQAGGLAQVGGGRLQLTSAGRSALADPASKTLRTLWEGWLGFALFDELSRIECIKGQGGKGRDALVPPQARRAALAKALARCPIGGWVTPQELLRFVISSEARFAVAEDREQLYIEQPRGGTLSHDFKDVWLAEERYVLAFLFEYAATLGVIDVAFVPPAGALDNFHDNWMTADLICLSRYDGLAYFRLTDLGAYCLGTTPAYEPRVRQDGPVLQVSADLTIAANGMSLEAADLMALDTYAVRVCDGLWRLERSHLLAAVEAGRSLAEIGEFLTARSGGPLPEAVTEFFKDTAARCEQITQSGPALLYECRDEQLATLIACDSRTGRHCLKAGVRHLAVPAGSDGAFRRGLHALGYVAATAGKTGGPEITTA